MTWRDRVLMIFPDAYLEERVVERKRNMFPSLHFYLFGFDLPDEVPKIQQFRVHFSNRHTRWCSTPRVAWNSAWQMIQSREENEGIKGEQNA